MVQIVCTLLLFMVIIFPIGNYVYHVSVGKRTFADPVFDKMDKKRNKGTKKSFKRCLLLVFSITLHNIPEGLAVGVSFGSATYGLNGATLGAASLLALGIGLQNFPEGTAVSVPERKECLD